MVLQPESDFFRYFKEQGESVVVPKDPEPGDVPAFSPAPVSGAVPAPPPQAVVPVEQTPGASAPVAAPQAAPAAAPEVAPPPFVPNP